MTDRILVTSALPYVNGVKPIFDSWVFRAHAKLLNSLVVASVLAKLVVPRLDAVRH
jgi:hypothetical protein